MCISYQVSTYVWNWMDIKDKIINQNYQKSNLITNNDGCGLINNASK